MRLYFLRHGIAEDLAESDFARELTARGRRRVMRSAAVMRRLKLKPKAIFSSPRLRARQTAEIVGQALGLPVQLAEQVNFGFDLDDIHSLSQGFRPDDELMFVGHNPDMSLLAHELTGVDAAMKKGGLARVDTFGRQARHGELVWLIAPKVFDALSRSDAPQAFLEAAKLTPPQKLPQTPHHLHDLIRHRWSPIGFDRRRDIQTAALMSILEAGRWAASSYNLQPWRFIVARRQDKARFQAALSALAEGNQAWARHAAVLMIGVISSYGRPDVVNRHASHDLGLAISQMVLQALEHGIYTHQMGGFSPEKARKLYAIPDEYEAFTAIAMGYRARQLEHLNDGQRQREAGGRDRHDLRDIVFGDSWGIAADFLA